MEGEEGNGAPAAAPTVDGDVDAVEGGAPQRTASNVSVGQESGTLSAPGADAELDKIISSLPKGENGIPMIGSKSMKKTERSFRTAAQFQINRARGAAVFAATEQRQKNSSASPEDNIHRQGDLMGRVRADPTASMEKVEGGMFTCCPEYILEIVVSSFFFMWGIFCLLIALYLIGADADWWSMDTNWTAGSCTTIDKVVISTCMNPSYCIKDLKFVVDLTRSQPTEATLTNMTGYRYGIESDHNTRDLAVLDARFPLGNVSKCWYDADAPWGRDITVRMTDDEVPLASDPNVDLGVGLVIMILFAILGFVLGTHIFVTSDGFGTWVDQDAETTNFDGEESKGQERPRMHQTSRVSPSDGG